MWMCVDIVNLGDGENKVKGGRKEGKDREE